MNHQKLDCYQRSLKVIKALQDTMPSTSGLSHIKDQLKRAMTSATLNIVEGNGRFYPKDRRKFFNVATSSLCEVDSCLELLAICHPQYSKRSKELQKEVGIIYAMVRRLP